jgi:hypothetical protein
MKEFIETYQEAQKEANQYECENANYACETECQNGYNYGGNNNYNNNNNGGNNNNNNNNNCVYYCLVEKNLDYCVEGEGQGQNQQNMNELVECRALNEQNGNNNNKNGNNNYYGSYSTEIYYVGAYCTSSGVYVGTFTDSTCTKHAPSGTYEKYMYGYSLPTTPLVSTGCLSCAASSSSNNNNNNGQNNNNNYNNGNSVSELCSKLYQQAGKCETNLKGVTYKDESSCDMIHNILPKLNSAFKSATGGPEVAKVCAWAFGFGFFALAGYVFLLHKKVMRQKAELDSSGYVFTQSTKPGGLMS